jgi:hypothetical protein
VIRYGNGWRGHGSPRSDPLLGDRECGRAQRNRHLAVGRCYLDAAISCGCRDCCLSPMMTLIETAATDVGCESGWEGESWQNWWLARSSMPRPTWLEQRLSRPIPILAHQCYESYTHILE